MRSVRSQAAYAIKTEVRNRGAETFTVRRTARAKRRLGRPELARFSEWNDGRPGTEIDFKPYRQATNKIAGISADAAAFLRGFLQSAWSRVAHGDVPMRPWASPTGRALRAQKPSNPSCTGAHCTFRRSSGLSTEARWRPLTCV